MGHVRCGAAFPDLELPTARPPLIPMYGPYAGSKKQARVQALEQRKVAAMKRRLGRIYELAQSIRDDAHLNQILADIDDDAVRAETRKLIEPFLSFPVTTLVLTDDPHTLHLVKT